MLEKTDRKIGDDVLCEWDSGVITRHTIADKKTGVSQSGVMYRVNPALRRTSNADWIDSEWFFDMPQDNLLHR